MNTTFFPLPYPLADLQQMHEGIRLIEITGAHVEAGTVWIPPTMTKVSEHNRTTITSMCTKALEHLGVTSANTEQLRRSIASPGNAERTTASHGQVSRMRMYGYHRGDGERSSGPFAKVNQFVRNIALPRNLGRFDQDKPFICFFRLGGGVALQIVVSTKSNLAFATEFGTEHLLTDSRWTGPKSAKLALTSLLAVGPLQQTRPG
jgi:hypothetical protein